MSNTHTIRQPNQSMTVTVGDDGVTTIVITSADQNPVMELDPIEAGELLNFLVG